MIWTKPADFAPNKENPTKGLVGLIPGGFQAGFADGSVRFIPAEYRPGYAPRPVYQVGRRANRPRSSTMTAIEERVCRVRETHQP